jgi:hypothetical protein
MSPLIKKNYSISYQTLYYDEFVSSAKSQAQYHLCCIKFSPGTTGILPRPLSKARASRATIAQTYISNPQNGLSLTRAIELALIGYKMCEISPFADLDVSVSL